MELARVCMHEEAMFAKIKYSQTCFSDHLSTRTIFFVSLENGFLLKHT